MYINGYMPVATVIMFKVSVVDAERRLRSCRTSHYKLLNKSLQTTKIDNKKVTSANQRKTEMGNDQKKMFACMHVIMDCNSTIQCNTITVNVKGSKKKCRSALE